MSGDPQPPGGVRGARHMLTLMWLRAELCMRSVNPLLVLILALWLLAAVAWLWLVPDWQRQWVSVRGELARAADQRAHPPAEALPSSESVTRRNLDAFNAVLGDARHVEQQLRTLFAIARDLQLEVPAGQYKLGCAEGETVCSYRIQLPLKGSYLQIRTFAEQSLRAIPFASLDELVLRREAVADADIDARLAMTLFVRRQAVAGEGAVP